MTLEWPPRILSAEKHKQFYKDLLLNEIKGFSNQPISFDKQGSWHFRNKHLSVLLKPVKSIHSRVLISLFSSSATALPVSGKQGWRRRSLSSSTRPIPCPRRLSCPSLSPCLTTAPWTCQRRRSSTSLRRWWWALCFSSIGWSAACHNRSITADWEW